MIGRPGFGSRVGVLSLQVDIFMTICFQRNLQQSLKMNSCKSYTATWIEWLKWQCTSLYDTFQHASRCIQCIIESMFCDRNVCLLRIAAGHYMSLVMSDQRPQMSAALTTPFMETHGMCFEIWVMFLGSGDAKVEILLYTEELVDKSLTIVMSMISLCFSWYSILLNSYFSHLPIFNADLRYHLSSEFIIFSNWRNSALSHIGFGSECSSTCRMALTASRYKLAEELMVQVVCWLMMYLYGNVTGLVNLFFI